MKKATLVLGLLAASTSAAWAQSSVTMYGIVDVGVRLTTNSGLTAANSGANLTQVIPGGMSQSRLGINVTEDLGGGLKGLVNMEHRFNSDNGTAAATDFWRQSWVGIQSADFGRITLGRQYNILFDLTTTTFVSYPYSPYAEIFKPEIGMQFGSRNDNMVKYMFETGGFRAELQGSASEGNATTTGANGKSLGGFLRYQTGPVAVGGAYMEITDLTGGKAKGTMLGGSYTSGPLYVSGFWSENKFDATFAPAINAAYGTLFGITSLVNGAGSGLATAVLANDQKRDMYTIGAGYQLTTQVNLGANYWHVKQSGYTAAGNGNYDLMNAVLDYAFSKRTDAYMEFDNTRLGGAIVLANGQTTRAGYTVGLRHRF